MEGVFGILHKRLPHSLGNISVWHIVRLTFEDSEKYLSLIHISFLLGLAVDIFGNTPGMNAAAATVLAFMREPILRLVTLRDSVEDFEPGIKSMGFSPFFRYILLCTFLFCTILLVIDTFSFFNLPVLLLKILTDASITVICILCAEAIRRKK